VVKTARLYDH